MPRGVWIIHITNVYSIGCGVIIGLNIKDVMTEIRTIQNITPNSLINFALINIIFGIQVNWEDKCIAISNIITRCAGWAAPWRTSKTTKYLVLGSFDQGDSGALVVYLGMNLFSCPSMLCSFIKSWYLNLRVVAHQKFGNNLALVIIFQNYWVLEIVIVPIFVLNYLIESAFHWINCRFKSFDLWIQRINLLLLDLRNLLSDLLNLASWFHLIPLNPQHRLIKRLL